MYGIVCMIHCSISIMYHVHYEKKYYELDCCVTGIAGIFLLSHCLIEPMVIYPSIGFISGMVAVWNVKEYDKYHFLMHIIGASWGITIFMICYRE